MTREEIQEAIKCNEWQKLRLSLKGQSTESKLRILKVYLKEPNFCCAPKRRRVQVHNYLNALSRGGIIQPVQPFDLENDKVRVIR
jgi:hypothetical protein